MRFWKYQGIGNDFVLVEDYDAAWPKDGAFVRWICDRFVGVGADGVLYISSSEDADARMKVMNARGDEAEMCGNGLRCAARHIFEERELRKERLRIETAAGIRDVVVEAPGGDVRTLRVDMGAPVLDGRLIPMDHEGRFVNQKLEVEGTRVSATGLSMGNPHLVIFDPLSEEEMGRLGPLLERHELFPRGTNVEFAAARDGRLDVRVYERGAGWTKACGTGACASVVAAALLGLVPYGRAIEVRLPGGSLEITVSEDLGSVIMAGPAELVFRGELA